jgi:DNA (cytosine-5)-methyltransferase 1
MIALDLFAGTGWGVACKRLGIDEYGVEIMPQAIATREANGMRTIYHDVWEGLENRPRLLTNDERAKRKRVLGKLDAGEVLDDYELLIASPPCQTFSMAGGGAGRKALDTVHALIGERAYLDIAKLRAFGESHDPRTALVLTPLAHVARDAPTFVVFEQVPPVLPVWERCAEEMRKWGYSVWVGIVNSEQYGVPQTRKRAILIARADGQEAMPPIPTHSKYYPHDPTRLDPGVKPWVSMADALGWSSSKVGFARRADDKGAATADGYRERDLRPDSVPAQHVTEKARSWSRRFAGAGSTAIVTSGQIPREGALPSHTITSAQSAAWVGDDGAHAQRVTLEEAAALQSYPEGFEWCGTRTKQFLQVGNAVPPMMAEAILKGFLS